MFFLLLVQKKVPKKSTPATIYSRCRAPWLSFTATVNSAKQFLSSTSTIRGAFALIRVCEPDFSKGLAPSFSPIIVRLHFQKMQAKKIAPPEIPNNTACPELVSGKQSLRPFSSIINTIIKYKDCTCALACPAGGPPQADDFFGSFYIKACPDSSGAKSR